jgi:thiol-disulfide isomerase/thioredoxin
MLGKPERDKIMRKIFLITLAALMLSGCTYSQDSHIDKNAGKSAETMPRVQTNPTYKPYNADADSMADIDKALARARMRGTKVMVVMGANWCPDSRGLAARLDKPEFQTLISENYELVYVSAGTDPGQKDQNRDISKRFGVDAIVGTPTVFIVTPNGKMLNEASAGYWRNAENLPVDMSYAYFDMYAKK